MKSNDVYEAFNLLRTGDPVVIERCSIDASLKALAQAEKMQDSSLLVMASAPDRMENANTASVISHRRRASRPPAVALSRKQTASTGKKSVPARRAVARRTFGNSRTAVRSTGGTRYTLG